MRRIYTVEEMKRAEQWAVNRGASFEQLMENAGQAAAKDLFKRLANGKLSKPRSVLIICGKGNNAGDGLVIARALTEQDIKVKLFFVLGRELSELAQLNLERLASLDIEIVEDGDNPINESTDWIIDAVFGTGYVGDLPEEVSCMMAQANEAKAYRIALDMPTGLNCDSGELADNTFNADLSYTFAAYKPAHFMPNGKSKCGEIVCLEVGI
ncbi:MAG: NAD(P)H-hydrate epimerase [Alcaligenaceae bacterium]|nr:NAD(P)H-hydrate epimerase [Alcaligenaceae bacterium]